MDGNGKQPNEQELDQLVGSIDSARAQCAACSTEFDTTAAAVTDLKTGAAEFRQHAETRANAVRERIEMLRDQIEQARQDSKHELEQAQLAGEQLAGAYDASAAPLVQVLEAMASEIAKASEQTESDCAAIASAVQSAKDGFDAHQERLHGELEHAHSIVIEECHKLAQTRHAAATEQVQIFGAQLATDLATLRTHSEEQHHASMRDTLEHSRSTLEALASGLKEGLTVSGNAFASKNLSEMTSLARDIESTKDTVHSAAESLKQCIELLNGTVNDVTETVGATQTGLRTVAGILEKTQRALESLSSLD